MDSSAFLTDMREAAGLTQTQLAQRSGIARTVINAYEHGTREPSLKAARRLAIACGQKIEAQPAIDFDRNGQVLADVLDLAENIADGARQ
ncbi:MAG: helix-turn-helix transcriptional regulator [Actinobacteria bacterium]|nr:helix-turn-helix transcriptional regulator [Actinomycetota bacterium]